MLKEFLVAILQSTTAHKQHHGSFAFCKSFGINKSSTQHSTIGSVYKTYLFLLIWKWRLGSLRTIIVRFAGIQDKRDSIAILNKRAFYLVANAHAFKHHIHLRHLHLQRIVGTFLQIGLQAKRTLIGTIHSAVFALYIKNNR